MTNPSTLIFLGLAVVWAVVLLPEAVKRFSRMRRSDSIRSFNHQLLALDRSGPSTGGPARDLRSVPSRHGNQGGPLSALDNNVIDLRPAQGGTTGRASRPNSESVHARQISPAVRRRRQEITATLVAAVVLTLLCLLAFGRAFLVPQLIADVLLATYLYLVAQANRAIAMPVAVGAPARHGSLRVGGSSGSPSIRIRTVHDDAPRVAASR